MAPTKKFKSSKTTRLPADENQFSLRRATNFFFSIFVVPRRAFDEQPTYLLSFASSGALFLFPKKKMIYIFQLDYLIERYQLIALSFGAQNSSARDGSSGVRFNWRSMNNWNHLSSPGRRFLVECVTRR